MDRIIDSWCCDLAVNSINRSTGTADLSRQLASVAGIREMSKYTASFRSRCALHFR
jgi:hypothetical protein